jgi:hypothetical protein
VEAESARWNEYVESLTGTCPLGTSGGDTHHEDWDLANHNLWISTPTSSLWRREGAAGCPSSTGAEIWATSTSPPALRFPERRFATRSRRFPSCATTVACSIPTPFHEDESCLEQTYDLVLASGSFQYSIEWREDLGKLG